MASSCNTVLRVW